MGTISAISSANIFMSEFEEKYIYSLIKNKCVIYLTLHRRHFYGMDYIRKWSKKIYEWNKLKTSINQISRFQKEI